MRIFLFILLSSVFQIVKAQSTEADFFALARNLYEKEKYEEAGEAIDKYLLQNANSFDAWLLKGDCHQKEEEVDMAIQAYNQAEELNEQSVVLYTHRGSAFLTNENYDKALRDLNKAIELKPNLPEAYYYRGNVHYAELDLGNALGDYDRAIELNPDYMAAYYMRAATYAESNKYSKAMDDYEKTLSLKPDLDVARYNVAVIRYIHKEYELALAELNSLDGVELPDMPSYYYFRAEAKYFTNDKFEACVDYDKARKLGDQDAEEIYTKYCLQSEPRKRIKTKRVIQMAF